MSAPQQTLLAGASGAAPGGGTWNTANPYNVTLSNGNRTATHGSAPGTYSIAESATAHSSGKWYCELVPTSLTKFGTNIPPLFSFNKNTSSISGTQSPTAYVLKGALNTGGTALTQVNANDIVMMAIDIDAHKVWFGLNGTWLGGGNPAAGTGETAASIAAGTYRVKSSQNSNENLVTVASFLASQCAYSLPSGFAEWG